MSNTLQSDAPDYGSIRSTRELGQLMPSRRKRQGWTLEKLSGFANVSMRVLSELERGKETAEIGKAVHALQLLGLEVVVLPRHEVPASLGRGTRSYQERSG